MSERSARNPSRATGRPRRRRTYALVLAAVLLPLAILLALQYRWLADLERTSSVARLATLDNFVAAVDQEIAHHYRTTAERALSFSAQHISPDCLAEVAYLFDRRRREIARTLFLVSFVGDFPGTVHVFDPVSRSMRVAADDAPETRAIQLATVPWLRPAPSPRAALTGLDGDFPIDGSGLYVDEHDPEHRLLLKPVVDADGLLVGLAGMVLDPGHFEREVLPLAITKALPSERKVLVAVRDPGGRLISECPLAGATDTEVEGPLSFVFRDWRIGLQSRFQTPEQWARANFVLNVSLSAALALVLLAGVGWALRTAARELRLSRMKSDFVANVSHELRTPLSSIQVFGELLRLGRVKDAGQAREFGGYIENESRRLSRLIQNILDFSKIESGRRLYRPTPTDLAALVTETAAAVETRLHARGARVELELPASPLPPLEIDPDALAQAVANLLDNAARYGGREIHVRLRARRRGIELAVRDDGIGIARDEQEKIFDRFHRVGTGLVHDVKGSGLGLAIVKHVVEAHGGRVSVHSAPGRGSTFTLHLPTAGAAPRDGASAVVRPKTKDLLSPLPVGGEG